LIVPDHGELEVNSNNPAGIEGGQAEPEQYSKKQYSPASAGS
jgi:hypothetical protein